MTGRYISFTSSEPSFPFAIRVRVRVRVSSESSDHLANLRHYPPVFTDESVRSLLKGYTFSITFSITFSVTFAVTCSH